MWPSACRTASAPRTRRLRGSIARPARTPTDASPPPSRTTTHGSGPSRFARSSMSDSFIPFSGPVYPGAPYTLPRTLPGVTHPRVVARLVCGRLGSLSTRHRVGRCLRDTGLAKPASRTSILRFGHRRSGHVSAISGRAGRGVGAFGQRVVPLGAGERAARDPAGPTCP